MTAMFLQVAHLTSMKYEFGDCKGFQNDVIIFRRVMSSMRIFRRLMNSMRTKHLSKRIDIDHCTCANAVF